MVCFVSHTSVDCHNAFELSEWWKALLGYVDIEDDPNLPGHEECLIQDPEIGHRILFIEVPDKKQAKNRLHLDLRPRESSRDEEVDRLITLGTAVVADLRGVDGPGSGWVVFADPEGNGSVSCAPKKNSTPPAETLRWRVSTGAVKGGLPAAGGTSGRRPRSRRPPTNEMHHDGERIQHAGLCESGDDPPSKPRTPPHQSLGYGSRGQVWPRIRAYPSPTREPREVAMVAQWIKSLVRRVRIARYRRREVDREIQDERRADHLDRAREGIKDTPPFMGPPA